ncbi:hypothetical protein FGG08_007711 [Glutinoglossum americanum]|uniref:Uncharacterized protein n=1 Tax=Glutinoglossum americanum TaxID=1670608 RepID=A0A9P8L0L2_9PEZI|nr:hypothetical protein FGG08_007711 [Glutinoglossum americanum]
MKSLATWKRVSPLMSLVLTGISLSLAPVKAQAAMTVQIPTGDMGIVDGCGLDPLSSQGRVLHRKPNAPFEPCFPRPKLDPYFNLAGDTMVSEHGPDYEYGYASGLAQGKEDLARGRYNPEGIILGAKADYDAGYRAGYARAIE